MEAFEFKIIDEVAFEEFTRTKHLCFHKGDSGKIVLIKNKLHFWIHSESWLFEEDANSNYLDGLEIKQYIDGGQIKYGWF